jgi:mono/diheme cytochrome c family protein
MAQLVGEFCKHGWLVLCLLFVCVGIHPAAAQGSSQSSPGEVTFKARRALCHGENATGNTKLGKQLKAPNLHSPEVQKLSQDGLIQVISKARNSMPPFGEQLKAAEIEQIIDYLRTLDHVKK